MGKRGRAWLRAQDERWKKRVRHYYLTEARMWPNKEPAPIDVGKVAAARSPFKDGDPWGPEGTRAQEKQRAEREAAEQLLDSDEAIAEELRAYEDLS